MLKIAINHVILYGGVNSIFMHGLNMQFTFDSSGLNKLTVIKTINLSEIF